MKKTRRFMIKYSLSIIAGLFAVLCFQAVFPQNCPKVSLLSKAEYLDIAYARLEDAGFDLDQYDTVDFDFYGDEISVQFFKNDGELVGGVGARLNLSGELVRMGIIP